MAEAEKKVAAEERERAVIERARRNAGLMAQDVASLGSYERGEPTIPGAQVIAEAEARSRRAGI